MVEVSPALSPPPPGGVLRNIQALRGLAALMVVLVHLEAFAVAMGAGASAFDAGNAGVDLFFVISGFIMVFTTLERPTTPLRFFGQRLRRVVPLYWLVTLAVFAVALLAPALVQATRADLGELIKSLLFIPFEKANGFVHPVAFVGWTLNYEMAFYAVFALGLLARRRWVGVLATMLVIAAAAAVGLWLRPEGTILGFYTRPIILEFAFGMGLGLWWSRAKAIGRAGQWAAMAAIPALFLLMLAAPIAWPDVDRAAAYGLPALGIVLGALVLERSGARLTSGWTQKLGDASYAIYLTHFFVTQAFVKGAEALGATSPLVAAVLLPVTLGVVIVVGVAVHELVEKPISRRLSRRQ